jgi:hypothetical protein
MSTLRFRDSEKTINNSGEDYLTLSNYHDSFNTATKTSQLRMAIAPGTVKYFNKSFSNDALKDVQQSFNVPSEYKLTPFIGNKSNDDSFDYSGYPKLNNN